MTSTVVAKWRGPWSFVPGSNRPWLFEESKELSGGGIYLWTLRCGDVHLVNYVGESASLHDRLREHVNWFLSGRYWFYDPVKTAEGKKRRGGFDPGDTGAFERFMTPTSALRARQFEFLAALDVFCWFAGQEHAEKEKLKLIESAIISHLRSQKGDASAILDNAKVSRTCDPDHTLELQMAFDEDICVQGLMGPIKY